MALFKKKKDKNIRFSHDFLFETNSPPVYSREPPQEMTPEERDARTVFCMQLSARIRPRDLEEFFSSVGVVCILLLML